MNTCSQKIKDMSKILFTEGGSPDEKFENRVLSPTPHNLFQGIASFDSVRFNGFICVKLDASTVFLQ